MTLLSSGVVFPKEQAVDENVCDVWNEDAEHSYEGLDSVYLYQRHCLCLGGA